jgi:hypothetical protein
MIIQESDVAFVSKAGPPSFAAEACEALLAEQTDALKCVRGKRAVTAAPLETREHWQAQMLGGAQGLGVAPTSSPPSLFTPLELNRSFGTFL